MIAGGFIQTHISHLVIFSFFVAWKRQRQARRICVEVILHTDMMCRGPGHRWSKHVVPFMLGAVHDNYMHEA